MTDHSALIERLEAMADEPSRLVREVDRVLAEAAVALRDLKEWRDIATAPKDGTEFQAWVMSDSPNWKQGWWEPKACIDPENGGLLIWGRVDYDAEGWDPYPATGARWLPLPSAPHQAKEAGG